MIAIVDYGSGNIQAISNVYTRLGIPHCRAATAEALTSATKVILPGVGAFDQAMQELDASGMRVALDQWAIREQRPILGICVGMQLFAHRSEEGSLPGLGWIDATVQRFDRAEDGRSVRVPHLGWNSIEATRPDPLLDGVDCETGFYFLHSYYVACRLSTDTLAQADYGSRFTCAVRSGNIMGVQFHPEKSHRNGVRLLSNFAQF